MKDKNGVLVQVGDELLFCDGKLTAVVGSLQGDGFIPSSSNDPEFSGASKASGYWEVIRRADGSDPRKPDEKRVQLETQQWFIAAGQNQQPFQWQKREPACINMHFFNGITENCQYCGILRQEIEEVGPCQANGDPGIPPQPSAPTKSPSELYADFHRIVTETVAREAPKVRVVTDFTSECFICHLSAETEDEIFETQTAWSMELKEVDIYDLVHDGIQQLRRDMDPLR